VDVEAVMREIRERIAEKRRRLVSEEELRELQERPLPPVVEPHDLRGSLLTELLADPLRWNYRFDPEAIYRSSREGGGILEKVRRLLRPVQKLFWNPTPMISALSRQGDLNLASVQLLHNLTLELTRLHLQVQQLGGRVLQLQGRLEFQARREKTLEVLLLEQGRGPVPSRDGE
jgi:hypothetical protein